MRLSRRVVRRGSRNTIDKGMFGLEVGEMRRLGKLRHLRLQARLAFVFAKQPNRTCTATLLAIGQLSPIASIAE